MALRTKVLQKDGSRTPASGYKVNRPTDCANWTQNGSNLNPTAWSGDAWMKMIYMHMAIVTLLDVHHE